MSENSNIKNLKKLDFSSEYCQNCKLVNCVAICIDKMCTNNGPICYNCLYSKHLAHCCSCIPIQKIKIDNLETSSFNNYIKFYKKFIDKTKGQIEILFNDQQKLLNDLENLSTNSISYITLLNLWKSLVCNNDNYVLSTDSIKESIEMKIQKSFEGINLKLSKIFNYNEYKQFVYEQEYQTGIYYIHSDLNKPCNLLYSENANGDIMYFSVNREDIFLNAVCICRPVTLTNQFPISSLDSNYVKLLEENNGFSNEIVSKKFEILRENSVVTDFSNEKSHLLIKFDYPIPLKKNKDYSIKIENNYKGSYYLCSNEAKEGLNDSNIFTIKECSSETRFITNNNNTTNNQYPSPFRTSGGNIINNNSLFGSTSNSGLFNSNNNPSSNCFGFSNTTKPIVNENSNSLFTPKPVASSIFGQPSPPTRLFGQSLPSNNDTGSLFTGNKSKEYVPIKYPYSGMIAYIQYSFKK